MRTPAASTPPWGTRVRQRASREAFLLRKRVSQLAGTLSAPSCQRLVAFVSGNQRSGTNMVMDVLERSMDTDVYHERDPRAFDNYEMRDISTVHHLVDRSRARVVVIKALCEAQDLRRLLDEFAPAKAIWVLRSHEDTVNSMSVSFGNFAPQAKRIARDRNGSGWLGRGMSDETHEKIRALVKDDIDEASAAALQWYYRNVLFFEQGLMDDTRATLVRYEDVVARPEIAFYRLFDFLGIRFLPDHGRGIFGTSVRKAPPPVLSPAVQGLCMQLDERFRALCL